MISFIYIVLSTAMFFLQDTYFKIGGVDFSLKNPCALAILLLALLNFIATVRLGRFMVLVRHAVVQMLPYLIPLFFSYMADFCSRCHYDRQRPWHDRSPASFCLRGSGYIISVRRKRNLVLSWLYVRR